MNFLGELKHPCRHDAQNDSEVQKITHTFSIKKIISQQPSIRYSHIGSIRPGWAHSQRRVGVNITSPSIDRHVNEL